MNEVDKILTLLEKGYTKAEIDAMIMTPAAPEEPAPVDDPEPEKAPEPPAEPAPEKDIPSADDPVPKTLPEELTSFMSEIRQSMANLTAAVQAKNIQTNSIDTTRPEDLNDMLAAYINPPRVNK